MKKIALILLTVFFSMNVQASHYFGQTFTLHFTGIPNTYVIKGCIYRDCTGITAPNVLEISYTDSILGGTISQISIPLVNQQILPIFLCDPTTPFDCINSYGIEAFEYSGVIVLPYASATWRFWNADCCRSNNLTTISTFTGIFCEASLDNLNYPTNSLPEFNLLTAPLFCLNQMAVFPSNVFDLDGDSIVYSLIPAAENTSSIYNPTPLTYIPPYTSTQFVSSSTPILFDSSSGIISFKPNLLQHGVFVVKASEYRNGVLIGFTMRDLDFKIDNGINYPNLISGNVYADLNSNGIRDIGEYDVKNIFIQSNPFYAFGITNGNGDYSMHIGTGPHTVNIANLPSWFLVNPASYIPNFTSAGNFSTGNDFGILPIFGITDFKLNMSIAPVRPSSESLLNLSIFNLGSATTSGAVTLTLPNLVTFDSASVSPISISGNLVTWNIPSMTPLQLYEIDVYVKGDSLLNIGDSVYFEASVTATPGTDINPSNNLASGWVDVINSFDPNIKTVFPNGTVPKSAILSGQPLTYRIEFENTGNANALTVRLTDILPAEVKLNSIEILAASHAYTTQIIYPRQLEFTFNGINLPPTSVDPINSKGYIIFKVTPLSNLNVGTLIANEAKIYFDNNPPVITPMAEVVVVGTTGIAESNNVFSNTLFIYPNPTHDRVNIEMPGAESGKYAVSLYSIDGKLINALSIQKQKEQPLQLDLSLTEKGIYIIIVSKDKSVWSSKVIRN